MSGDKERAAPGRRKRIAVVASKGTLDMAYPPLILATTAASMGWEAGIFFTFYGLDILHRKKIGKLRVSLLGNPAMAGPVPSLVGALPGMTAVATWMMKRKMARARMPDLPAFLEMARGLNVRFFACSTTMGLMGIREEDLIEGSRIAGAAAFLDFAGSADVQLLV